MVYLDRADGGRALAIDLARHQLRDPLVLALPRGGVPVAFEVARALGAPLDIVVVRKLGVPGHTELAMGAIASGGVRVMNKDVVDELAVSPHTIERVAAAESAELARRERRYRGDRPFPAVGGRVVVVVDDGLATGATMRAAVRAIRALGAVRVVAAAPVGSEAACAALRAEGGECVCASTPEPFAGVGMWYRDFHQVTDDEVCALLVRAGGGGP